VKNTIICLCLLLIASSCGLSQLMNSEKGKICGTVLDESGTPASNVHVIAILLSPGGHSGGFPGAHANSSGHYCIDGLSLGSYGLSGYDEGLGYPMQGNSFYSWRSPAPQVTLTRQKSDANLDWKIPFRAGFLYLHLPAVHSPDELAPMMVTLVVRSRSSVGHMSVSTFPEMGKSKQVTVLLPPQEDVLLSVTAPGYQSWPADGSEAKVLNVLPGAIEDVAVPPLKRTTDPEGSHN
jgi:hypothetical protein